VRSCRFTSLSFALIRFFTVSRHTLKYPFEFSPQIVREPEKLEGLRFSLALLLPLRPGLSPKLNQSRLLRMHLQSELRQPLPELLQESLGFRPVLESDDQVSRPGESHPEPLSEPCLNVSAHTAPAMEPRRTPTCQCAHSFGLRLEAIEAVVPPSLRKGKFRPPDKLLALLKGKP
jgi:hypothetical protein